MRKIWILLLIFIVNLSIASSIEEELLSFEKKLFVNYSEKNRNKVIDIYKKYFKLGKNLLKTVPAVGVDYLQKAYWLIEKINKKERLKVAILLSYGFIRAGKYKEAIKLIDEILGNVKDKKVVNLLLARKAFALFKIGKIGEAKKIINDLLLVSKDKKIKKYAKLILGNSYMIKDVINRANKLVEKGDLKEALRIVDLALLDTKAPQLVKLKEKILNLQQARNKVKEKVKNIEKGEKETNKQEGKAEKVKLTEQELYEKYVKLGKLSLEDKDYEQAEKYFSKAYEINKNVSLAWLLLKVKVSKYKYLLIFLLVLFILTLVFLLSIGRTEYEVVNKDLMMERAKKLIEKDKLKEAASLLQQILMLNPTSYDKIQIYKELAFVEYKLGNYQKAMAWIKMALKIDNNNVDLLTLAAKIFIETFDRSIQALEVFKKLYYLDPSNEVYLKALVECYHINSIYNKESKTVAEELLRIDPDNKSALIVLSKYYIRNIDDIMDENALRIVEKTARLVPKDVNLQIGYLKMLYKFGKWQEVIEQAKFLIKINPSLVEIHKYLVNAYLHLKKPVELLKEYRKLVHSLPYSNIIQEILYHLENWILKKSNIKLKTKLRFKLCNVCHTLNGVENTKCEKCGAQL